MDPARLAEVLDALLPQTQCERCGYPGCRPYAEALARGEAELNQCPPGGEAGVAALAQALQRPPKPLNPVHGEAPQRRWVAVIDESICIGCTKCIQACPVDAIVGSAQRMHTVIAGECSGCELCLPPCPVDCIAMVDAGALLPVAATAPQYRARYLARERRLTRLGEERQRAHERKKAMLKARATATDPSEAPRLSDPVARALAAARARKTAP